MKKLVIDAIKTTEVKEYSTITISSPVGAGKISFSSSTSGIDVLGALNTAITIIKTGNTTIRAAITFSR
ncbi:MAG: hypothetical protein ACTSW1_03605 [Candidatus Hodarchaeales archaeon]